MIIQQDCQECEAYQVNQVAPECPQEALYDDYETFIDLAEREAEDNRVSHENNYLNVN